MLGGWESQRVAKAGKQKQKRKQKRVSMRLDVLVGKKKVVGAFEHPPREITHDRLCLDREVSKHDIGVPPSQETDGVGINMSTEESHRTGSSKRTSTDLGGEEAQLGT